MYRRPPSHAVAGLATDWQQMAPLVMVRTILSQRVGHVSDVFVRLLVPLFHLPATCSLCSI